MKCSECQSSTSVKDSRTLTFDENNIPNPHNYTSLKHCLDLVNIFSTFKSRIRTCTSCGLARTTIEVDVNELRSLLADKKAYRALEELR